LLLSHCPNIHNVSSLLLGRVRILRLEHCSGITDVSELGAVRFLRIVKCESIKDVSILFGAVKVLVVID
jgi:hypothetical protein